MATLFLRYRLIALVLVTGTLGCSQLFFYPHKKLVRTPADIGLIYEDVHFSSPDGVRLHGWFLPATKPEPGDSVATVLFLHGNAENISTHIGSVYWLADEGFNVFLFDYRGFGRSGGEADIAGALQDARAALEVVAARPGVGPIVVFGQSLGGSLAVTALVDSPLRTRVSGLILDSAFSEYRLIAREKLGEFWLTWPLQWPLSQLVSNDHSPLYVVDRVSPIPLLITHAEHDPIVPVHHAYVLYERAREPKTLWILPHTQHTALTTSEDSRLGLLGYLRALTH